MNGRPFMVLMPHLLAILGRLVFGVLGTGKIFCYWENE